MHSSQTYDKDIKQDVSGIKSIYRRLLIVMPALLAPLMPPRPGIAKQITHK